MAEGRDRFTIFCYWICREPNLVDGIMAKLSSVEFFRALGLEGNMRVFVPEGRTQYYVFFRVRVPGSIKRRQVSRSCGTTDLGEAKKIASEIFAEEVSKYRISMVNGASAASSVAAGTSRPQSHTGQAPIPSNGSGDFQNDPTIAEICELYDRYMASPTPGDSRPQPETAKTNKNRLRQLARLLKVETVSELRAKMPGLTHETLRTSPANFVSLLRSAAGPFWPKVLREYKKDGVEFETPFPTLPKVLKRPRFRAPSLDLIIKLKASADEELLTHDSNCYLLFLMALGAGLRLQEATHVRWEDVLPNGIYVRNDWVHKTKSDKDRDIPLEPEFLSMFETFRRFPGDWVIADERGTEPGSCPKKRSLGTARRLAKWLRIKLDKPDLENPVHWLRKAFGSVVCFRNGLYVASRLLGHSTVAVTEAVYAGLLDGNKPARVI